MKNFKEKMKSMEQVRNKILKLSVPLALIVFFFTFDNIVSRYFFPAWYAIGMLALLVTIVQNIIRKKKQELKWSLISFLIGLLMLFFMFIIFSNIHDL
ncbi:MAG: hypothetical protein V1721_07145 [Pseudomonadota bacterium]